MKVVIFLFFTVFMFLANAETNDIDNSNHQCDHVQNIHITHPSMGHSNMQHVHTECSQCLTIGFLKHISPKNNLQKNQLIAYLKMHYSSFVSRVTTPPPTI